MIPHRLAYRSQAQPSLCADLDLEVDLVRNYLHDVEMTTYCKP